MTAARRELMRLRQVSPPSPEAEPSVAAVGRITEAAYRCFGDLGFKKTTMEAIAREAGMTRATVYNYFSGKDEIIERIRTLETDKVNIQLRARIRRFATFAEQMTECVFLITRIAHANPYIRGLVDSLDEMSRWAHPSSLGHRQIRDLWSRFLTAAAAKGDLASELQLDEVISWLILSQDMLLTKVEAVEISDADLRRFIRRFVVKPLLPD